MSAKILVGDCRIRLAELEPNVIDACVTDPPYELGFMGKSWDSSGVAFDVATWQAIRRVLVPGGYLLAFGGTRTFHRMTVAIEDAGFEIHDCLSWLYGSGFPKHKSKLKPAWEPIIVARKPAPRATPLQIDVCRLDYQNDADKTSATPGGKVTSKATHVGAEPDAGRDEARIEFDRPPLLGRWPANVILDQDAAARLDAAVGTLKSGANPTRRGSNKFAATYGDFEGQRECIPARGADTGGPSRFFYCAKASRAERERGLEDDERRPLNWSSGTQSPGTFQSDGTDKTSSNDHPTVKPVALMRWLTRLVTPPGGTVLDPFLGSGTTGCATEAEGFDLIGCELNPRYADLAKRRIESETPLTTQVTIA